MKEGLKFHGITMLICFVFACIVHAWTGDEATEAPKISENQKAPEAVQAAAFVPKWKGIQEP